MKRAIRVCFISPYAYSLFNQNTRYLFGGSEVRAWLLGRGLANLQGYDVSFAVKDHGQNPVEEFEGIKVYTDAYFEQRNLSPNINIFLAENKLQINYGTTDQIAPKTVNISISENIRVSLESFKTYKNIDADIYFAFGVSNHTASLTSYSKHFGKKAVIFIASDGNLLESYTEESTDTNYYGNKNCLCRYTIDNADFIIAQTETQSKKLKEVFNRNSMVLKNPIDATDIGNVYTHPKQHFLWIGKSNSIKRPDLLVEAALRTPSAKFIMVMNRSNSEIFDTIMKNKPDNISVIESIPFNKIDSLFGRAHALVNTSEFEGFPNTFLQAGKHSVPILSLNVDPDRFIERYRCGMVAHGSLDVLTRAFILFLENNRTIYKWGRNIKSYVLGNHSLVRITAELNQLITEIHR